MKYDKDKVDEMTLALLYLVMSKVGDGGRASKGVDLQTMARLRAKGWIAESKIKDMTFQVTAEGAKKAEALFSEHFGGAE